MLKILVTGGAGFIGSNLSETLIAQGHHVTVIDNFSTGKMANIEMLLPHPAFRLITGDIRNLEECKQAVEGVDYVFHEAALGSVPRSISDPITTNDVNVSGFLNMLVAARDAKVKRFIYAASSSTYGDSEALPKVEEVIGRPLSPYAITKYVNELYADVFSRTYGIECIGLRYFNVFGRKQDPNGAYAAVIPLFVKQLMNHESPLINGDGEYSRDFTYIDDIVAGVVACVQAPHLKPYDLFNIGNHRSERLLDMIRNMGRALGVEPKMELLPMQPGDVPVTYACVDKLRAAVGWEPTTPIEVGIPKFAQWYREYQLHPLPH